MREKKEWTKDSKERSFETRRKRIAPDETANLLFDVIVIESNGVL